MIYTVATSSLFEKQLVDGDLQRDSFVLCYATLLGIASGSHYMEPYYRIFCKHREFTSYEDFIDLSYSITQRGLVLPLVVDFKWHIIDGAHRFACVILLGISNIEVIKTNATGPELLNREWFKDRFDQRFIDILDRTKSHLLRWSLWRRSLVSYCS